MIDRGELIVIDLAAVQTEKQLFALLGSVFHFGGPDGNIEVTSPVQGNGWGMNWDALKDSLSCVDSGGIWGASRIPAFPLRVEFKNAAAYRHADKRGYVILSEILADVRGMYANGGLEFEYVLS